MENKQLQEILGLHKKWLDSDPMGRFADLRGAYLRGAVGEMKRIKTLILDTYPITYTSEMLQIGCQRHPIKKWWGFTDAEIDKMDGENALIWWNKHKTILKQIVEMSPCE